MISQEERFGEIKQYLSRMRGAEFEIIEETASVLRFEIRTQFAKKLFSIYYSDSSNEFLPQRPTWQCYYLIFEQDNYPSKRDNCFIELSEMTWFKTQEDCLERIKTLKNRYNR